MHIRLGSTELKIISCNSVYFPLLGLWEWNVLLTKQAACTSLHSDVSSGNNRVTRMGSQEE